MAAQLEHPAVSKNAYECAEAHAGSIIRPERCEHVLEHLLLDTLFRRWVRCL